MTAAIETAYHAMGSYQCRARKLSHKGFPPACNLQAYLLGRGIGCAPDAHLSLACLGRAIEAGDPEAVCALAVQQYLLGMIRGGHLIELLKINDCLMSATLTRLAIPLLAVLKAGAAVAEAETGRNTEPNRKA